MTSATIFSVIALPICTAPPEMFRFLGQFDRRERRPVNSVASSASADGDDLIAGPDVFVTLVDRDHRHVAAVDQRIAEVSIVETDGTVDRRDPHAVAVVANSDDHAVHHRLWMQHARWQRIVRSIRPSETEDVGAADRFEPPGPYPVDHGSRHRVPCSLRRKVRWPTDDCAFRL